MDGKRRTPVSPEVEAGEGRSILPAKDSRFKHKEVMNITANKTPFKAQSIVFFYNVRKRR